MALRKKTGGGSRKGRPNKSTVVLRDLMDAAIKRRGGEQACVFDPWIDLMVGVRVQKIDKKGNVNVYDLPPNEFALKAWTEFRYGKARQAIDVTSAGEKIQVPVFVVPPFIDAGDAGKH